MLKVNHFLPTEMQGGTISDLLSTGNTEAKAFPRGFVVKCHFWLSIATPDTGARGVSD